MRMAVAVSCLLFLTGCAEEENANRNVKMMNSSDDSIGTIKLSEEGEGMSLDLDLEGLKPGVHAIHFHEKAACKGPDFKSAGDHFNPDDKEHGLMNANGAHAGDMPNITVEEDGTFQGNLTANVTFKDGKNSLLTKDGTSIVIHDKADDGMSQPAGDAGDRIACGEIKSSS